MIVTVPTIKSRSTESIWKKTDKKQFEAAESKATTDVSSPEEYESEHPTGDGFVLAIQKSDDVNYFIHEIKVNTEYGKLSLEVDTSFKANMKFDKYFASTLNCSMNEYVERISKYIKKPDTAKAHMVSLLKFLYCYVNSDKLPTFEDFCGLFDYQTANQVISIIGSVLKEVGNTLSKN